MPTQKRVSGRNYIGLVSDETEQPSIRHVLPQAGRRMTDFLRDLLAAMRGRHSEAR